MDDHVRREKIMEAKKDVVVETAKAAEVKAEKPVAKKPVAKKPAAEKAEKAEKKVVKKAEKVEKPVAKEKAPKKEKAVKPAAEKKAAGRKATVKADVFVQFAGKSISQDELVKIAKDVWVYDLNQKEADFKSVAIYVKPEENKAYFVVNGEFSGSFDL